MSAMGTPPRTNGHVAAVSAQGLVSVPDNINATTPSQVSISHDSLAVIHERISRIEALLQGAGANGKEEATSEADLEPKQALAAVQQERANKVKTKPDVESSIDDEGEESTGIEVTEDGRVQLVVQKDIRPVSSIPTTVKRKEGEFAFTYIRNQEISPKSRSSMIEIHDQELLEVLKSSRVQSRPTYYRAGREELSGLLFSPYEDIVWAFEKLKQLALDSSQLSAETRSDLSLLLRYVEKDPSLVAYFDTCSKRPGQIAWDYLWTLFPAGTEILTKLCFEKPQILMIQAPPYRSGANKAILDLSEHLDSIEQREQSTFWVIKAWCYDHDGKGWLRVCHKFQLQKYQGERSINELECYPLAQVKEPDVLRAQCLRMGECFAKLFNTGKTPPRFNYDDHVIINKQPQNRAIFPTNDSLASRMHWGRDQVKLVTNKISEEVIVDPEPWIDRYGTLFIGKSEPVEQVDSTEKDMDDSAFVPEPSGEMLRFCPPRFIGCLPKDRLMAQFKVSAVSDNNRIEQDDRLFKKALQLEDTTKDLLLAHVRYQKDSPDQNTDIIKGKGNNLVVLLHGPPGVGKTLTAETVAQATGRTLLNTTIADVGLEPQQAERKLSRIFSVASRWHAILLIDEADAFLEKRDSNAMPERNAFVTVMLRILEYHTGIVILTTNRLTTLDSAVQSRIHLAIKYEELSAKQCIVVFETSLQKSNVMVREQENIINWLRETAIVDQDDAQKAWNGREIRNLVTGAIACMRYREDDHLSLKHVKDVFQSTKAFKKQLGEQMQNFKHNNQGFVRSYNR